MDYTTDTSSAVEEFLTKQYLEALSNVANRNIDIFQLKFCASLRDLSGSIEDPKLSASMKVLEQAESDATELVHRIYSNLETIPESDVYVPFRVEWLKNFIASVEQNHAEQSVIIRLNSGFDEDAVAEALSSQLFLEGAHIAALEELSSLT